MQVGLRRPNFIIVFFLSPEEEIPQKDEPADYLQLSLFAYRLHTRG